MASRTNLLARIAVFLSSALSVSLPLQAAPTLNHSGGGKRGYASTDSKQPHALDYNVTLHFLIADAGIDELTVFQNAFKAAQISATLQQQAGKHRSVLVLIKYDRRADMGPIVKVLENANHGVQSATPSTLHLLVFASLTQENAKAASERLGRLGGIDGLHSSADWKTGEVQLRLLMFSN